MKMLNKIILSVILMTFSLFAQQQNISGIWAGKLELPNSMKLTIVFNIVKDDSGIYHTTLDSPDQGAKGIPTESTIITGDSILIKIPVVQGFYSGKIFYDEMKIDGKWTQGGMSLDLTVKKVEKLEGRNRPQEPKEPFPYNSEELLFENEFDGVVLAGTLTFPKEGNNFPAVVLITGSGAQNRDEELLGHKPFLVLSDYLTRNGFAVLRYDDRGIGKSTGNFSTATSEDFAKDVFSAVEFLKTRNGINKSKIGLIGHSEGGLIAPMVANQTKDVAFIILMAGPGIPGDSILYLQDQLISKAAGENDEEIQRSKALQRKLFQTVVNINDNDVLKSELTKIFKEILATLSDEDKQKLGDPEVYMKQQIKTLTSPWFKYFLSYNPVPTLEKVKCPVLALNGENDLQVPYKQNLSSIESTLKKAGNKNFEIKSLPGLNHLFQTSKTGAVSEYGQLEETISPLALETMLNWLKKTTK